MSSSRRRSEWDRRTSDSRKKEEFLFRRNMPSNRVKDQQNGLIREDPRESQIESFVRFVGQLEYILSQRF